MHLGHLLSYNLDNTPDIIRVTKDQNRKANFYHVHAYRIYRETMFLIMYTFKSADPFVNFFKLKPAVCLCMIAVIVVSVL